jgi:hypothetical protein
MDVQRIYFWSADWTQYAQGRIQDRVYVNDVLDFGVP